jgi:hypothetical protein
MALTQISTQGIKDGTITGTDLATSFATTGDFTFTGANYNVVWNKAANMFQFADDAQIKFGTGGDMSIRHASDVNIIDAITYNLEIKHGSENIAKFIPDGAVELYHDGSKKFYTTLTGAYIENRLDIGGANLGWSYPKPLNVQGSSGAILALRNWDTTTYAADTMTSIDFNLRTGNTGNQNGSCEIRAFKENGTNGNNARGLSFYTGANGGSPTERMRIDSSGQVGIGVTPDTWSTGAGITVGTSQGTLWGAGDQINLSGNAYFNSGWKAAASKAGASQIEQALGNIDFKVSGNVTADSAITFTNAMRINSSGVGIGTTSPGRRLVVAGDTNTVISSIGATDGTSSLFLGDTDDEDIGSLTYNHASNFLSITTNASERMRIDSSGKVGIGISSPVGLLHLHQADSGTVDGLMITNTSTTNNGLTVGVNSTEQSFFWNGSNTDMLFATNNTERMRIDSSGRVGIGTTNPQNKLHLESSSNTYLRIVKTGNSSNVYLGNSGGEAILESTGGAIKLKPNGRSNDFVLNTSGFVGIGTTSPTDKLHVVGTTNLAGNSYLTNAYVSGNIYLGGTAAANALDDYEEGTYTPVIYYDSVNNHTYSEQVGTYTKIGNFCHGYIVITWDEVDSEGQVKFSLPFTSSNISGTRTSGYFIYQDGLNLPSGQGSTHLILYGGQNSSQIAAYFTGSTNNSELGTNPTKMTNTHTSSHNTTRMVFHYRTA